MKKTFSLIELIISITLMGVIVLGAMSIYYAGQQIFISADRKTDVLNEFTYVIEVINKNVLMASGDASNPGLSLDLAIPGARIGIVIRQDISNIGFPGSGTPNNTPFDYSDDRVIVYWFVNNAIILDEYGGVSGEEYVSRRFSGLGGSIPLGFVLRDGGVEIQNLAFRFDPSQPIDPHDNPQVTSVDINGNSTLFFAPASYSF
ncbi:MAG: hypothetical protein KAJ14_06765 [Candidatus Omnitrophica bacterium]|nr:hypothetical protein [Candidatus Omnitrophota bacterium]